jgi:mRNA-binding protein PUF3
VADSETDWRSGRQTWADAGTSSIPRSSGVSPARKLSLAQAQPLQQFADSSSTFFPISRATAVSKPANSHLDPKSTNFTCARPLDALNASFTNFSFGNGNGQSDSSQRPDTGVTSWPDASSVQSPNDDGRSVACSEYFAPSSGAASRNGSLPPSRHSAEPAQYGQAGDVFARYAQAAPRQPSFSQAPGRAFQERSGSVQSESFQTLSRLAHDQEQDARLAHRASVSTNGFAQHLSPTRQESHVSRDGYLDVHHDASYRNGTYTPDGYLSGQVNDPNGYTRSSSLQFDSRNGPNGASARNSPFYSHAHTPPVIDRLNPYSSEQTLAHPNNAALVQNKLVNYQFQQDRRGFAPQQFQQQQYQQMLSATQLRHPYPYQFLPAGMSISAVPQHMSVAINTMPSPLISVAQPLRGPRDQQSNDGSGVGGLKLAEFRRDIKMGKKWELHMLYDDVVEFAGDQHGSRFIQNKLETANSEVKDKIFKELAPNTLQLMQDVFGNYVIQKFFEHGDQTQKRIMAGKMKGHFLSLACQMYACRVVQKVCFLTSQI